MPSSTSEGGSAITHALKTWREAFTAIHDGFKRHEFRLDDRLYIEGDTLLLQEFEHCPECGAQGTIKRSWGIESCKRCLGDKGTFTGRELTCEVTHIGRAPDFGIPKGYAVMTVKLPGDVFANLQEGDLKP